MSIFNSIKRLVKHSAVYGIGHIITRSFGFLLLPLYTNIFPRDDFGVAGLVFTYLAIFINLYTFGIDVAFFRYFILEETEQGKKKIFTTAFVTMTTTSLVFSLLIFFNAPFLAKAVFSANVHELTIDLIFLIRLAAGILFFDAIGLLPFLILRAREKSLQFIVFKFVNVLINVGFNILLLGVLKKGIEGIFIANFISSFVTFIVMLLVVLKNLSFSYSFITLKDLFAFGLPYMPSTLSVVLMDTIDRVFIERLMGVDAV
ncbi:oligosaccharide flippase family protein, partial [candidate division KSB1 bacterium]|nr:oligosaccharide flippase family protein [candidate division KSB1 bacterium]